MTDPDDAPPHPTFFKRRPDPLGYDVSDFDRFALQIADDAIAKRHQEEIDAEVKASLECWGMLSTDEEIKTSLRIKSIPEGFDHDQIETYRSILDLPIKERSAALASIPDEDEFWVDLLISRAEWEVAAERGMSPITEDILVQMGRLGDQMERETNEGMRISHMPGGPGFYVSKLSFYRDFLDMPPEDQERVIGEQRPDHRDFYRRLLNARADYEASHGGR